MTGVVHDPRGDALVGADGPPAPDAKRVAISYDPAVGRLQIHVTLWSPAPSHYQAKAFYAYRDCSSALPEVLAYDTGQAPLVHLTGAGIANVVHRAHRNGTHLTETWTGAALQQLPIGCIRQGQVATLPVMGGVDDYAPVALR